MFFSMKKIVLTGSLLVGVFAQAEIFNLAKYQSVTADSYATDKPEQYANDGFVSQDSRWVSTGSGPHWLEIELAVPMTVGSAHLYSGGTWNSPMSNIQLQYHDGSSWVDIPGATVSGNTSPELNLMFDLSVTAQKFRLYTTDGTARVVDLALYPPTDDGAAVPFGTDMDLNLAKLRQVEASSIDDVNFPKLAIDGYADDTSCWIGEGGTQELEISWLQAEKIRGIHLYSGYDEQPGTQIENFNVDYWDSGSSSWVTFANGSVTGNAELEREVRFSAAKEVTKIRIQSLDTDAPVIRELVVLPENGGSEYPLWTDVQDEVPPTEDFMDYDDGYYTIENRDTGTFFTTSTNGSSLVSSSDAWFQLLLNIGTDTYRLRSKESGECFEVSLASTNEGAAIVEGVYSSAPHQRWRLIDSGDGTHFRIVNVWSGLALDVDGTSVVQKSITSDASQEWSFDYRDHVTKKGQVAFFHYNYMYQPGWFYSWSATAENDCAYGDYHPMQWGWFTGSTPVILRDQPKWYSRAQVTCAMGFNEPDKEDQSNIPEEDAADQWPRFERMRLPLVGPCPAQNNGTWRKTYEPLAEERGLRSEYMALHWYAGCNGGSPQNIINVINNLYNAYGKPIWITEFAVKDWSGTSTGWDRNDNFNWLAEFLWRAESIDHLKKYSLFEWGTEDNNADPTVNDAPTMGLHIRNDKTNSGYEDLSELGLMLAGWDCDDTVRDAKEYIFHNKGSGLRLIDHPASNTVTQANILHRTGTDQFIFETAPNGKKYIIGVNDGRRLSYDGSSVGLSAAGTTGTEVEWSLSEYQHGWYYINHPGTGKRLRITSAGVIDVVDDATANNNVRFRFVRPAEPVGIGRKQVLPYAESFEDGRGAWIQSVVDDYNWRVNSGGTPTAAAGPSGASDGDWYLYAEGHQDQGSGKTASMQCNFNLGNVVSAEMSFDYHMYGNYISYLALDVYDGSTWSSNVWKKTGQQQSGSDDAWSGAVVDLSAYAGNEDVILRFRTRNGTWNAADPAIDDIRIEGEFIQPPYAESFEDGLGAWRQSDDDDLNWTWNTGATPTGNTGPSGASDGSWYLYVENHTSGEYYKTASVECTFDLGAVETPRLTFDYHMYGSYIDYLAVDVSDGATWTSNVWKKSGAQHASSDAAWSNAVVDLTAFVGQSAVTIRFRSKQKQWHAADTAIDNIQLEGATLLAPSVPEVSAEPGDGFVTLSWAASLGNTPITYTVQRGTDSGGPYTELTNGLSATRYTDEMVSNETIYYYVVYATDEVGADSDLSAEVLATPSMSYGPYGTWAEAAFTNAPPGTDESAPGNPDGDSNSNLLEWLLGTDPMVADSPITSMTFDEPNLVITYTRRIVEDVSIYAEVTSALVPPDWATTEIIYEGVISSDGGIETVAVLIPNDSDQRYIRLRIEQ